jgi:hypothetical protein
MNGDNSQFSNGESPSQRLEDPVIEAVRFAEILSNLIDSETDDETNKD